MSDNTGGIGWRRMPVFVASTFRDMDYERDVIARIVIPTVNARLHEAHRGVSLYPVDLRWGIDTDSESEAALRQRIILETCVSEVRRCRPLFVGIIGTKYGWVPPAEISEHVVRDAELSGLGFPLSVTAIEMLTAVRAAGDDGVAPILLARRAPEADRLAAAASGVQDDPPGSVGAALLAGLADHLDSLGHPLQPYESRWQAERGRWESAAFVTLLTESLLRTLDEALAKQHTVDWLDAELAAQRWAAEREVQQFAGRTEELAFISGFWSDMHRNLTRDIGDEHSNRVGELRRQISESMIAVVGESGSGKTALLAKVATDTEIRSLAYEIRRQFNLDAAMHCAYVQVAATVAAERLPVCVLLLLAQVDPAAARSIADRHTAAELELADVLDPWLAALAAQPEHGDLIVVVDGIDRLVGSPMESLPLGWLPTNSGTRVRFIVSAPAGSAEEKILRTRPSTYLLPLVELPPPDAVALIANHAAAQHKSMPPPIVEHLVRRSTSPRWLVVATELLLSLMQHDYLLLQTMQQDYADPEEAIRGLLETIAADLPAELDALHGEVLDRLQALTDDWFGMLIAFLNASISGLREQDLHLLLTAAVAGLPKLTEGTEFDGPTVTYSRSDLALARDMLSAFITVTGEEWRFRHATAAAAAYEYIDSVTESLGFDVRAGYRRALVGYLSSLPLDDALRAREALPLLAFLDEHALLARVASDTDMSTDESLKLLTSFLIQLPHSGFPPSFFVSIVESAEHDRGRLTVLAVVIGGVLPQLPRPEMTEVGDACRRTLAIVAPDVTGRQGLNAAALGEVLATIMSDPLNDPDSQTKARQAWLAKTEQSGQAAVRELLSLSATTTQPLLALFTDTSMVVTCAIGIALGELASVDPEEPALVRARLDHWRDFLAGQATIEPDVRALVQLKLSVAEQAAALAWPSAGFAPAHTGLAQLRAMVERLLGNPDVTVVFGQCSIVDAVQRMLAVSEHDELTESAAALAYDALQILEDALWFLAVQQELTPDNLVVETVYIQCAITHSGIAAEFDQYTTACRSGIAACSMPHVVDLMGWDDFVEIAADCLSQWLQWQVDIDPRPVLAHLVAAADARRRNGSEAAGFDLRVELAMLMTALYVARRLGDFDLGHRIADRAFTLWARGEFVMPAELGTFDDIMRMPLDELEDELLELLDDLRAGETLEPADWETVVAAATWTYEMRIKLLSHDLGSPADLAGAAFCAAIAVTVFGQQDRRAAAEELRQMAENAGSDERGARLLAAVDALLSGALH